jgi:hypothetical protein
MDLGIPEQFDVDNARNPSISVTWNNIELRSDFKEMMYLSSTPLESLLVQLGKKIETGVFEKVVKVVAEEGKSLEITIRCLKNEEDLAGLLFFS